MDGYGAKIFKVSWKIIKTNVTNVVLEFFEKESMFKVVNSTLVTLMPKTSNVIMVKEFRPISCCTTIYKIIYKIMTTRLSKVLRSIIDDSHASFVPGLHIQDHILLAYELIKGYRNKVGPPKCMLQMDLQKAYDIVEWYALEAILRELSFPPQFIIWVMLAVTIVSYRYKVNGDHTGILKGKRGHRKMDPLSPLLFVIAMEYMHRVMQRMK